MLAYHALDVAACADQLLQAAPTWLQTLSSLFGCSATTARRRLRWLYAVHDAGKFGPLFQAIFPEGTDMDRDLIAPFVGRDQHPRHDEVGLHLCHEVLLDLLLELVEVEDPEDAWDVLHPLVSATTGHHGIPTGNGVIGYEHRPTPTLESLRVFALATKDLLVPPGTPPLLPGDYETASVRARRASWFVAGLGIVSDWLGSDQEWHPYLSHPVPLDQYWRERAIPQAERAVTASRLAAARPPAKGGFATLFPGWSPRGLQEVADSLPLSQEPTLVILEATTGAGKTEAALTLASRLLTMQGRVGLYVALPTQATANAIADRVRPLAPALMDELEVEDLTLAHGGRAVTRWLGGDDPPEARRWWESQLKRALLAPIGVGTIDQALLGTLPVRHQALRLLGLAGSVLVVDEVHAADEYQNGLLEKLLAFHALHGGSAILLTATLSSPQRAKLEASWARALGFTAPIPDALAPFPVLTILSRNGHEVHALPAGRQRNFRVRAEPDRDAVSCHLRQTAEAGACACWVRNTVDEAIHAARELAKHGLAPLVLHSRFALCDRLARETELLARFGADSDVGDRAGGIVLATQVVEQSLDLDFDELVTDLAPIDLVLQRQGRHRRHERDPTGARAQTEGRGDSLLWLHGPDWREDADSNWIRGWSRGTAAVYPDHGALWRTARLLRGSLVHLPKDSRALVEGVYGEAAAQVPEGLREATEQARANSAASGAYALSASLAPDLGYLPDGPWTSEDRTMTRLGLPTVTLRLCRQGRNELLPWYEGAGPRWSLSELRVGQYRVGGEDPELGTTAARRARASMFDDGEGVVLLRLTEAGLDRYVGHLAAPDGSRLPVEYSPLTGLEFAP